jgi:hypothetical protein
VCACESESVRSSGVPMASETKDFRVGFQLLDSKMRKMGFAKVLEYFA